jgi:hypothetical protein
MPLKLNVGLSKKVGDANYGSRGASVNVELELESALVGEPDKLKERIRQIFSSLRFSLAEELSGNHQVPVNSTNGHHHGNGSQNGSSPVPTNGSAQTTVRPATASQINAIHAIARSQQIDLSLFLQSRFQRQRPEDLTIKEASGAIDEIVVAKPLAWALYGCAVVVAYLALAGLRGLRSLLQRGAAQVDRSERRGGQWQRQS